MGSPESSERYPDAPWVDEGRAAQPASAARLGAKGVLADGPVIVVQAGESLDHALKVLGRRNDRAGLRGELERRRSAESPGQRRRSKRYRAARRRARAAARLARGMAERAPRVTPWNWTPPNG